MSVKTYLNIWLMVSLLLLAATCPAAGCPVGDLDGDCEVDWQDIQLFAKQWLDPACSGPNCADLDGIHGDFLMTDLPPTSWKQAESCLAAAKAAGLKRLRLGNVHILR